MMVAETVAFRIGIDDRGWLISLYHRDADREYKYLKSQQPC